MGVEFKIVVFIDSLIGIQCVTNRNIEHKYNNTYKHLYLISEFRDCGRLVTQVWVMRLFQEAKRLMAKEVIYLFI